LIVDDVESNLYVAKGLMAPYGLSIETAASGFETIEKIKEGAVYDIVFMDHMMPKMDGIETTKNLRGLGYSHPVVALTANAVVGQSEMFLANGFDGFLSKPVDVRELNATLKKFVRGKQPPEVLEAARRGKETEAGDASRAVPDVDPLLAAAFSRDAGKAVEAMKAMLEKGDARGDGDVQAYVIQAHAMKSALANIGETALSAVAARLEQAGRDGNIDIILSDTRAFLEALRRLVAKQ